MVAIDLLVMTYPPHFHCLPGFFSSLKRTNDRNVFLFSSQTNGEERKRLDDIICESAADVCVDVTTTANAIPLGLARNIVFKKGMREWAVFLDCDVKLGETYIADLERAIETYGADADALGGGVGISEASRFGFFEGVMDLITYWKYLQFTDREAYSALVSAVSLPPTLDERGIAQFNVRLRELLKPLEGMSIHCLEGCNLIIKRDSFKEVGGFDRDFWSAEDRGLALKLVQNRKRILFAPSVWVNHNYSFGLLDIMRRKKIHGASYGEVRKKYPDVDKLYTVKPARWVKNFLKCFNPPHPFNGSVASRAYYAFGFASYAYAALASEYFGHNPLRTRRTGWAYAKDRVNAAKVQSS